MVKKTMRMAGLDVGEVFEASNGIILTGMGDDDARGLLRLRQAGALTFGQDRRSCIVYGMPKVAFEIGAVAQQAPPAEIPKLLVKSLLGKAPARIGR